MSYLYGSTRVKPPEKQKQRCLMSLYRAVNLYQSVSHSRLNKPPISSHSNTMFFPSSLFSSLMIHLSSSCFLIFSFIQPSLFHLTFSLSFFSTPHISFVSFISLSPVFSIPPPPCYNNSASVFLSPWRTIS